MRPRQSLLARLAVAPLIALAAVSLSIAWSFWGWLDAPGSCNFRIVGVSFLAFEYCCLTILSDNLARREFARAAGTIALVVLLFIPGLIADFGAIVTRSAADAAQRAHLVVRYEAAQRTEQEAAAEAERLSSVLEQQDRNLPLAALHAETVRADARRDVYLARGETPPWRIADAAARAEGAEATAQARDAAIARRDEARRLMADAGGRPEAADPQAQQMIAVLRVVGLSVSASDIHAAIGVAFALLMRLVTMIGFVVISPALRTAPESAGGEEESPADADPAPEVDLPPDDDETASPAEPPFELHEGERPAPDADWEDFLANARPHQDLSTDDPEARLRAALDDLEQGRP